MCEFKTWTKEEIRQRGLICTGFHLPYNPKLKERARELRKNMTAAEKKLWHDYLKKLDVNVLRQKPIDHYIVDFYIPKYLMVIEVDGDIHDGAEHREYDAFRDSMLRLYVLNVMRFKNEMAIDKIDSVYG